MRIASVVRPESVNVNYRARIPLMALESRGHSYQLFNAHELPHASAFRGFDVVHFCRVWEEPFQRLARTLRGNGVGITWDCDDNILEIEKETSSYRIVGGVNRPGAARGMRTMLSLAHGVSTPSTFLAEQFARYSDHVRVIENYLAPPMLANGRRPADASRYPNRMGSSDGTCNRCPHSAVGRHGQRSPRRTAARRILQHGCSAQPRTRTILSHNGNRSFWICLDFQRRSTSGWRRLFNQSSIVVGRTSS